MASITSAERLPDRDYSVHRSPPPVPSLEYENATASNAPQLLNEPGRPGYASDESVSLRSKGSARRVGSFGSFLRRSSSNNAKLRSQSPNSESDNVPPVPSVPSTRIAQAHDAASHNRGISTSSNRKASGEGRSMSMLRKSSKMRAAQEKERQEQERLARETAPPPRLPSHNPLPGISTFGGEDLSNSHSAYTTNPATANFSRPSYNMPSSNFNSSSSPAYAIRGATPASPARGKPNGEYVYDSKDRHESMTHRGRYSFASSTVGVNTSSPRRIRRRKDPTPFK